MMTLKVTYFSNNEVHKSIHTDVIHWYYTNGNLVIISGNDEVINNELILQNVILLDAETWMPKK